MDKTIIISALLGVLLYFGLEFKTKGFKWADFKAIFWISDNWWNLVLTAVSMYAYLYIKDGITREAAFVIGFAGNKGLDYMQDLKNLYFPKKTA